MAADPMRKLSREQLLQLLVEQSKELDQAKQEAAEAKAKAEELQKKLDELGQTALLVFQLLDQARQAKKAAEKQAKAAAENPDQTPSRWAAYKP